MPKPSLLGRFVMIDCPHDNGSSFTISRLAEQITKHLYLAIAYSPHTGEAFEHHGRYVIDIRRLALSEGDDPSFPSARLFPDLESATRFADELCSDPDEDVPVKAGVLH